MTPKSCAGNQCHHVGPTLHLASVGIRNSICFEPLSSGCSAPDSRIKHCSERHCIAASAAMELADKDTGYVVWVQVLFVDQSRDLWIRAVTGKGPVVKLASMVDCAVWHLSVGMLAFIADHKLVSPLPLPCSATQLGMMDADISVVQHAEFVLTGNIHI